VRPRSPLDGLSPRRRRLVVGLVALALAVALAVTVPAIVRHRTDARAVPAQDRPGPVLLVPGYGGGTGGLDVLAGRLRAAGREATVVRLPGDGTGDLTAQARDLDAVVDGALRGGAPSVDVVGYSAGGVVARVWAQDHDGVHKARRIVTLGAPHHGAGIAAAGAAAVPGACPVACQQLAPGSRLLAGLTDPVPTPPGWLSIWTTGDQTVTPPDSARLDGAVNVAVQSVCPGRQLAHGDLPTDPVVAKFVLDALGAGPLRPPDATDC
jgi:triacylglycerol lipase